MTVRSLGMLLALSTQVSLVACGGKLVAEQAFEPSGDQLQLQWETTLPEGEGSLWLKYHLETGSEYDAGRSRTEPVYRTAGTLTVTTSGNAVYDGVLRLDDGKPPTTQMSSTVTVGSSESCGTSSCTIKGRVRTLDLGALSSGSPLVIQANIPAKGEQVAVQSLSMQLRAKK